MNQLQHVKKVRLRLEKYLEEIFFVIAGVIVTTLAILLIRWAEDD